MIMTQDKFAAILKEGAKQRLGEERAQDLHQAITKMSQSLSAIADHRLALEEEPAFFF